MAPETRKNPAGPRIRRLLFHTLESGRHGHFALSVLLPTRQLLVERIQHDEGGQTARPWLVFDAEFARFGAFEVGEGLGPKGVVFAGFADDGVGTVVVGGRWAFAGGAEPDAGEVVVAFLRVCLATDDGEPVDGAMLVGVEAQAG